MAGRVLYALALVAIAATVYGKPRHRREVTELTKEEQTALITKLTDRLSVLEPGDIDKLLTMLDKPEMTETLKRNLATAMLTKPTEGTQSAASEALAGGRDFTDEERRVAWAMFMTDTFTREQKALYESLDPSQKEPLRRELKELTSSEKDALIVKLTSGEQLTLDDRRQLYEMRDNQKMAAHLDALAQLFLKDETKKADVTKALTDGTALTPDQRPVAWALEHTSQLTPEQRERFANMTDDESKPDETNPDTTKPDETKPDETNPDTTNPDETNPDETKPDETNPDETKPDETNPDTTKPDETNPDETKPDETKPDETNPDTTKPDETNPDETNPDTTKPDGTNPDTTKPDETNPDETNPEETKPDDGTSDGDIDRFIEILRSGGDLAPDIMKKLFEMKENAKMTEDLRRKLAERVIKDPQAADVIKAIRLVMDKGAELTPEQAPVRWAMKVLDMLPPEESDEFVGKLTDLQKQALTGAKALLGEVLDLDTFPDEKIAQTVSEAITSLTDEQKANLKALVGSCPTVTEAELEKMNDFILSRLKREVIAPLADCPEDLRRKLCAHAFRSSAPLLLKFGSLLKCDQFKKEEADDMELHEKMRFVDNILEKYGSGSTIGEEELDEIMDTGVLPTNILEKIEGQNILQNDKLLQTLGEDTNPRKAAIIMNKLKAESVDLSKVRGDTLRKLIKAVDPSLSEVEQFDIADNPEVVDDLLDDDDDEKTGPTMTAKVDKKGLAMKAKVAKIIKNKIGSNMRDATADEIMSLQKTGQDVELDEVPDDTMEEVLKLERLKGAKQKENRDIAARTQKMAKYSDSSSLTATDVDVILPIMNSADLSFIKGLKKDSLAPVINSGELAGVVDWDEEAAEELLDTVLDVLKEGGITPDEIKTKVGKDILIKGLGVSQINELPIATIEDDDVFAMFGEGFGEMQVPERREFLDKIKTEGTQTLEGKICKLRSICRDVSPTPMRGWNGDTVMQTIVDAAGKCNLDCDLPQFAELAKLMVNKYKAPWSAGSDWSMAMFQALYKLFLGLGVEVLETLPVDSSLPDIVNKLMNTGMLTEAKRDALQSLLRKYYVANPATTLTEVLGLSPVFHTYDDTALEREVPEALCGDVTEVLANADKSYTKVEKLEGHARYALKCLKRISGPLTQLGDLICYLKDAITDLDNTVVRDMATTLQFCKPTAMTATVRKAYKQKLMTAAGVTNLASIDEEKLGQIIAYLGDEDVGQLRSIPRKVLASAVEFYADVVDYVEDFIDDIFSQASGGIDPATVRAEHKKISEVLVRAFVDEKTTGSTVNVRRRRATSTLTCAQIKETSRLADTLSISDLSLLAPQVVIDCLGTLNKVQWSTGQNEALLTKLKLPEIYGPTVETWTASQIENSGIILEALTETELGKLTLTSVLLGYHGGRSSWSASKRMAVAGKWLQAVKSNDASTVTSLELVLIGHFVCGLTPAQLNAIPDAQFTEAYQGIRVLVGCSTDQLKTVAGKAVKTYGAVNTWDEATVTTLGHVVAGLGPTELSALPTPRLQSISPDTIAIIPASHLSGLTSDQIKSLKNTQLSKVTEEQYNAFNPSQKEAFKQVFGDKYHKDDSGAGPVKVTVSFFIILSTVYAM